MNSLFIPQRNSRPVAESGEPARGPFPRPDIPKITHHSNGLIEIRAYLTAGYHVISVEADGSGWNWERMSFPLHLFGNTGQMTGPWDFDLREANRPLIPSYWITQNGRPLGLWFFQRVALEDIAQRRLRGRFAVHQRRAGEMVLTLLPNQHSGSIRWLRCEIKDDSEAIGRAVSKPPRSRLPFFQAERFTKTILSDCRRTLFTSALRMAAEHLGKQLASPFEIDAAPGKNTYIGTLRNLPLLLLLWQQTRQARYLDKIFHMVDAFLKAEHWGGFGQADSYGVDGDLIVAEILQYLTWCLCVLEADLGEARREALVDKLVLQGQRFHDLALINRDYWGGSILQDHGWRCFPTYAVAALHLMHYTDAARQWAEFAMGRVELSLRAANRDGSIPPSSYGQLDLFTEAWVPLANTLRMAREQDPLEQDIFCRLPRSLDLRGEEELDEQLGRSLGFLNAMASRRATPWFASAFCNALEKKVSDGRNLATMAQAFFWYEEFPTKEVCAPKHEAGQYFSETGTVCFGRAKTAQLRLQCGPPNGCRAWDLAPGPCDRMDTFGGDGHFELHFENEPLLCTPDSAYRLNASTRSRLLVNGSGGRTSVGYPMSIPLFNESFGVVESAEWHEKSKYGRVRLSLARVFAEESGVTEYWRTLEIQPERHFYCMDQVGLRRAQSLRWLFQLPATISVEEIEPNAWRLKGRITLRIEAQDCAVESTVQPTPIVSSYTGSGRRFQHICVETLQSVVTATLSVRLEWA